MGKAVHSNSEKAKRRVEGTEIIKRAGRKRARKTGSRENESKRDKRMTKEFMQSKKDMERK